MYKATLEWERTAMRWRSLAEKRRDHHFELYRSGRWAHYYTEETFLTEMRKAVALAERWVEIAPTRQERAAPAKTQGSVAA